MSRIFTFGMVTAILVFNFYRVSVKDGVTCILKELLYLP